MPAGEEGLMAPETQTTATRRNDRIAFLMLLFRSQLEPQEPLAKPEIKPTSLCRVIVVSNQKVDWFPEQQVEVAVVFVTSKADTVDSL